MSNPRAIAVARNQERDRQQRTESMVGRLHQVSGTVRIEGIGEAIVDVTFPVQFIERPISSFGAQLEENQPLVTGAFPTVWAVVLRWDYRDRSVGQRHYIGARLGIVVEGSENQISYLDWTMTGKALVNPVMSLPDPDEEA